MDEPSPIEIRLGRDEDRPRIYAKRHEVFATELGQHPENPEGSLTSPIDAHNQYFVAARGEELVGFISVTPAGSPRFAIEKYWTRDQIPIALDEEAFELRLFVVDRPYRRRHLGFLLCHAAWRWAWEEGARRFVLAGHGWEAEMYRRLGARSHGLTAPAGALEFELMSFELADLREAARAYMPILRAALEENHARWAMELPFEVE